MAGPFAALERFFERLFERPAARLFHARLQPIQLERRLEREMEGERRLSADRTYVPNRYRVLLHPDDFTGFSSYRSSLEGDLQEALLARARKRGYTLLERPTIVLEPSQGVQVGDIVVQADVLDPELLRQIAASPKRAPDGGRPAQPWTASPSALPPVDQTAVYALPQPRAPRVSLEVRAPGQAAYRLPLGGGTLRIGRGNENDLVLPDDRVSRRHGRLASRQGMLIFTDLGSTNGSYVNGGRVSEIALGPGDVLQLGDSALTIHPER